MMISPYTFPGMKITWLTREQRNNLRIKKNPGFEIVIRQTVCKYFKITPADFESANRKKNLVWARHFYCYLCREYTMLTIVAISYSINRDHSSVIHSINAVNNYCRLYTENLEQLKQIENLLAEYIELVSPNEEDAAGRRRVSHG